MSYCDSEWVHPFLLFFIKIKNISLINIQRDADTFTVLVQSSWWHFELSLNTKRWRTHSRSCTHLPSCSLHFCYKIVIHSHSTISCYGLIKSMMNSWCMEYNSLIFIIRENINNYCTHLRSR